MESGQKIQKLLMEKSQEFEILPKNNGKEREKEDEKILDSEISCQDQDLD